MAEGGIGRLQVFELSGNIVPQQLVHYPMQLINEEGLLMLQVFAQGVDVLLQQLIHILMR